VVHLSAQLVLGRLLNNIGLAFIVAGFVASAVGGQLLSGSRLLLVLAWAGFGVVVHMSTQLVLGRLKE
jgi:hypothetical protein